MNLSYAGLTWFSYCCSTPWMSRPRSVMSRLGILAFHNEDIRNMLDMKVFVDTDSDVRLARRLKRDITDRGRDIHGVLQQYENHVKPAYDRFIATTMTYADIIVPRG